jgi:hypothetical protein
MNRVEHRRLGSPRFRRQSPAAKSTPLSGLSMNPALGAWLTACKPLSRVKPGAVFRDDGVEAFEVMATRQIDGRRH